MCFISHYLITGWQLIFREFFHSKEHPINRLNSAFEFSLHGLISLSYFSVPGVYFSLTIESLEWNKCIFHFNTTNYLYHFKAAFNALDVPQACLSSQDFGPVYRVWARVAIWSVHSFISVMKFRQLLKTESICPAGDTSSLISRNLLIFN